MNDGVQNNQTSPTAPEPPNEGRTARPVPPIVVLLLPLLFVLYPILSVYIVNRSEIGIGQTVRPLLLGGVIALVLTGLLWLVARGRDGRRAASAASILLLWLCTQDIARYKIITPLWYAITIIPWSGFYLGWCLLWGGLATWLLRTRRDVAGAWVAVWIVGAVLLLPTVPPVAGTVWTGVRTGQWGTEQEERAARDAQQRVEEERQAKAKRESTTNNTTATDTPDLYVLILDAYGRQDVLRNVYDVDNEPFLNNLTAQGFSVARESRANYIQTVLALEAALNLHYLDHPLTDKLDLGIPNIQASVAAKTLRARGYRIVYVVTGFPFSGAGYADEVHEPDPPIAEVYTPLERTVLDKTPFARLAVNELVAFDRHRLKLKAALGTFAETATIPGPKFVLAHILAPHPPFVFGAKGESVYPKDGVFKIGDATDFTHRTSEKEYRKSYAAQVQYVNSLVAQSLEALRRNAKRPAVVVVMGDHGPRSQTDWQSLDRTNVHESFYNLLAVSVPPEYRATATAATTGDTTAVFLFRRLFNDIYAMPYPPLPNRSFYSTLADPYRFTDVTDQVKGHTAELRP